MIHRSTEKEFQIEPTIEKAGTRRLNYEDHHGFQEGHGYQFDRVDAPEHGLFNFYSNFPKLSLNKLEQSQTMQRSASMTLSAVAGKKRKEKLLMLVSVTMYNEDYDALSRTLIGVHDNIQEFKRELPSWEDWNFLVIVFQDGIMKMNGSKAFPPGKQKKIEKNVDDDERKRLQEEQEESAKKRKAFQELYFGDVEKLGASQ